MRRVLLYFALKYEGNCRKILKAIKEKESVSNEELENVEKRIKSKFITILDSDYPRRLMDCPFPPIVLFYYGNIELLSACNIVGVIGARENSNYGEIMNRKIVKGLKDYKATIVSGMAIGNDSIAHEEALNNNMNTIAVIGSGIDNCYIKKIEPLYNNIKEKGLVISEYPNDTKANPENFLIRNRIIATLSDTLVVIEAKYKSGTMNTVTYALEMGKEICCVPSLATKQSGCNMLIKQGARLIESAKDIYD